jgi:hypothetical protein
LGKNKDELKENKTTCRTKKRNYKKSLADVLFFSSASVFLHQRSATVSYSGKIQGMN